MPCKPPVNQTLLSSDFIWRHRSWSILAQVMACCLMAPSHNLNHCWQIISKLFLTFTWRQFQRKYSTYVSFVWVWKRLVDIAVASFRGQWVNESLIQCCRKPWRQILTAVVTEPSPTGRRRRRWTSPTTSRYSSLSVLLFHQRVLHNTEMYHLHKSYCREGRQNSIVLWDIAWISNYIHYKMWVKLCIHSQTPKSLVLDWSFHPIPYWTCDYLSMLGLKLIHVSKRSPCVWSETYWSWVVLSLGQPIFCLEFFND